MELTNKTIGYGSDIRMNDLSNLINQINEYDHFQLKIRNNGRRSSSSSTQARSN